MKTPISPKESRGRSTPSRAIVVALASGCYLFTVLWPVAKIDGPRGRVVRCEASTVSALEKLSTLQQKFASSHHNEGFACDFDTLKSTGDDFDQEFLKAGLRSGYRFVLRGCGRDSSGVVTRYQITAVPVERGKTGDRSFCANQTGVIRFDASGSPDACLARGQAID